MTTLHKTLAAVAVALVLAGVAQAAPSESATATRVKEATAYLKVVPVGVTVAGDAVDVRGICSGLVASKSFTRCRAGRSRYSATACAWRITDTSDSTSVVMAVTTTRGMLATVRPSVCPALARFLRGSPGYTSVRLK